jgi:hypothetical protein
LQERSPPTSFDDIEKYLSSGSAASILATWGEQKVVQEIMVFLHSHGVGTARALRFQFAAYRRTIWCRWPAQA